MTACCGLTSIGSQSGVQSQTGHKPRVEPEAKSKTGLEGDQIENRRSANLNDEAAMTGKHTQLPPSPRPVLAGELTRPIALTIAGFDPSSGAGVTADLKTFSAHRVYGVACISALTVQSTVKVGAVKALPAPLVRRTLECLVEDFLLSGVKVGMLGSGAVAREVVRFLKSAVERRYVVLDPVLRSSSGRPLIDREGIRLLRRMLLSACGWITPNLAELAVLNDLHFLGRDDVPAAAMQLRKKAAALGNRELNIVVTGGDLDRPDDFLLTATGDGIWLRGEPVPTNATHGTGCAFSSALLCGLIAGDSPMTAAANAKRYVTEALRSAYPVGQGKGPMHHLYRLENREKPRR
jgi:hydroxymethylpyrimidine/phosphomethylpyrimidine kinase